MATQQPNALPQYYGQQLQDGTIVESPVAPLRHGRGSSDLGHELLRLPKQPHPAFVDRNLDPVSPIAATDPNELAIPHRSSHRRLGGYADPSDYGAPTTSRPRRSRSQAPSHRNPYIEDYPSDEDYDPQRYRRRPSRQYRPPPSAYENDLRPQYKMHYGSDDEYAPRRPALRVVGQGGGEPPHSLPSTQEVMRLPWAIWMGSNAKNHFVAFIGEFVGTTMFLFFAFSGTQVANIGSNAGGNSNTTTGEATGFSPNVLLYIALVFSFSLMANIAGSIFSSFLVGVLFPTRLNVRTTLSKGTSLAQGVFIEAILTAELVFTIFMLAKEKHKATFIAPVGIGLALFTAELVGVYYTGGSLNPARSFSPCVVTGVFDVEHWIYWAGPGIGAIIAVVFYKFIKVLEYEVANPGQDDDDKDAEVKEKEDEA
ncbi:aquaporin-like protein [Phaeosphaeriaceae sp. PMI808]|nr:aquaporin-like protein [Phaeosphaeriaceae sp. PMI808]